MWGIEVDAAFTLACKMHGGRDIYNMHNTQISYDRVRAVQEPHKVYRSSGIARGETFKLRASIGDERYLDLIRVLASY
jgi:hypothetical protein